jgi:hypothetical protein
MPQKGEHIGGEQNRAAAARRRHLDVAERQRQALKLRWAGASYRAIAQQLGCSLGNAWKSVRAGIKKTLQEPADEVRRLENDRLDRLQLALWQRALEGDLHAADRVLRVMKRRAELNGLDAPKQLALQMSDEELDRAIEAELERLAQSRARAVPPPDAAAPGAGIPALGGKPGS